MLWEGVPGRVRVFDRNYLGPNLVAAWCGFWGVLLSVATPAVWSAVPEFPMGLGVIALLLVGVPFLGRVWRAPKTRYVLTTHLAITIVDGVLRSCDKGFIPDVRRSRNGSFALLFGEPAFYFPRDTRPFLLAGWVFPPLDSQLRFDGLRDQDAIDAVYAMPPVGEA